MTTVKLAGYEMRVDDDAASRWVAGNFATGSANATASTVQFLDRCEAVLFYTFALNENGYEGIFFAYDPTVEVSLVPAGIDF